MRLIFLGTGAGAPSRVRNVTALAFQPTDSAAFWLFDCGEGTQHQISRSPLRLSQMERVFITHLHGDHIFGLPGLLATRSMQQGVDTPLTLIGPKGLEEFVTGTLRISGSHLSYPLRFEISAPGVVFEDAHFVVTAAPLRHRVECWGYAITEKNQPGRFDVDKAQALGVPPGPIYARLKRSETVTLDDGRVLNGEEFVGPVKRGRKVAICGDTIYTPAAVELARDADVLVHEATHTRDELELARRALHSTATMAGDVARKAGVHRLLLTHFSARYETDGGIGLQELLAEARAAFPNTTLAHDFFTLDVLRPDDSTEGERA